LLSIVFQAADILVIFLLARMIGLTVPLVVFFAIVPFVFLISILPISLGGLGVREGLLTYLLAQFGVNTSDGITLSFLVYLSRFIPAIPGGIVQITETLFGKHQKT
jgi:uncharacterized membrane protein YbhN (UPF0104 family)